ncbi:MULTISPECIES: IS66-like element accessory protein TnpA [unclassified Variovorax]|uniref:IS66-like element accessory protein TnpA n=1 Tax=unclassified Variovorax TaxID=663243 RepID=UPI003ECCD359
MKSQAEGVEPSRRHHERAFKARLIELSMQPGASVSAIAMANGINANLLFKWRRDRQRELTLLHTTPAVLLPVRLASVGEDSGVNAISPLATIAPAPAKPARTGVIELEIAGAQLRLHGAVDEASLCSVLRALRQSS